jgi:hypothetical protein
MRLICPSTAVEVGAVEDEFLVRPGEPRGHELAQQPVVDVALHRAAGTPAEVPAHQQMHAVEWLQLDDLEPVELDEAVEHLGLRQPVVARDLLERHAVEHQPGDEQQAWVGDDLPFLRRGELAGGHCMLPGMRRPRTARSVRASPMRVPRLSVRS